VLISSFTFVQSSNKVVIKENFIYLTFEKEEKNIYLDQPTKINVIVLSKKNSQQ
jgi:hypothetical protein